MRARRSLVPCFAALFATLFATPGIVTPATADEYSEFRVPEHAWLVSDGSLAARMGRSRGSNPLESQRASFVVGDAGADIQWADRQDPHETFANAYGLARESRRWRESQLTSIISGSPFYQMVRSDNNDRGQVQEVGADFSHVRYPFEVPVGFGVSLSGAMQRRIDRLRSIGYTDAFTGGPRIEQIQRNALSFRDDARFVSGAIFVALGRVRDASGVYEAYVIEQRLLETGALTRALSREARRRLAELMYMRSGYLSVRDRPIKDLWRELEQILRDDGALGEGGLDAWSVWRSAESILPRTFGSSVDGFPLAPVARAVGAQLSPTLRGRHSFFDSRRHVSSFSQSFADGVPSPAITFDDLQEFRDSDDDLLAGIAGDWHRPIGHFWQLDAYGLAEVPVDDDEGVNTALDLIASWIVSERWLASARVAEQRLLDQDEDGVTLADAWIWQYGFSVLYGVNDHLDVVLQLIEDQVGSGPSYSRQAQVQLIFDYRFTGRFSAPGFNLPAIGFPRTR